MVKPYIGVSVETVSSDMTGYGIPEGAVVRAVNEDSPAEKAGLKENDIITKVDDDTITSSNDLVSKIRKTAKGDKLTLTVYRKGEELTIDLTVDETKQDTAKTEEEEEQPAQDEQQYSYRGGQEFEGLDPFEFFGMR